MTDRWEIHEWGKNSYLSKDFHAPFGRFSFRIFKNGQLNIYVTAKPPGLDDRGLLDYQRHAVRPRTIHATEEQKKMMRQKRIQRIRLKILSLERGLQGLIKNAELSADESAHGQSLDGKHPTVPLSQFKSICKSFLELAEWYESLLEIYEMDSRLLSKREIKLLDKTITYVLGLRNDAFRAFHAAYSRKEEAGHREYIADLKGLRKKLKRLEVEA